MPHLASPPPHEPCRVVIVDNHEAVREMLCHVLLKVKSRHYTVAGLGGNGQEALDLCRQLRPDVLVLEMVLPDRTGNEVFAQLRREQPEVRVVFFTGCEQIALVTEAVGLGASGYVLKNRPLPTLIEAIHRACAGGRFIDPELLGARSEGSGHVSLRVLTNREREVTRLIAQGRTTKEAAAELGISAKTLDKYRSNLMSKLGVRDVVGLTHYAIAAGLIPLN